MSSKVTTALIQLTVVPVVIEDGTPVGGSDTLSYERSDRGVNVELKGAGLAPDVGGGHASGDSFTATGVNGTDTYTFENAIGSTHADDLTGDNRKNTLMGGDGDDTLIGGPGADTLEGGPGADELDGGGRGGETTTDDVPKPCQSCYWRCSRWYSYRLSRKCRPRWGWKWS